MAETPFRDQPSPYRGDCPSCGSDQTIRYPHKPPHAEKKGKHICSPKCTKIGRFCRRCRTLTGQWEQTEDTQTPKEGS